MMAFPFTNVFQFIKYSFQFIKYSIENGNEIEKARVTGFMKAKAFASHADEWLNQTLDDSSRGNISPD